MPVHFKHMTAALRTRLDDTTKTCIFLLKGFTFFLVDAANTFSKPHFHLQCLSSVSTTRSKKLQRSHGESRGVWTNGDETARK